MKRLRVAAIIPAYNEEKTIAAVVRPLVASPLVDEVIVISDGSTDQTLLCAQAEGARAYGLSRNSGKGEAMRAGVGHTQAEILLFLDADLIGFTENHIELLLLPVLGGARAMNIGMRDRGSFLTRLSSRLPLISGERAMRREVFEGIGPEFMHGFMVESSLNYYCRVHHLAYGAILMPHVMIRRKFEKVSLSRAVVQYINMFGQVIQAMLAVRLANLFGKF